MVDRREGACDLDRWRRAGWCNCWQIESSAKTNKGRPCYFRIVAMVVMLLSECRRELTKEPQKSIRDVSAATGERFPIDYNCHSLCEGERGIWTRLVAKGEGIKVYHKKRKVRC